LPHISDPASIKRRLDASLQRESLSSSLYRTSQDNCSKFVDKPSSPQGPLEAVETTPTAIKLQWKPPKDDGGSKIEKYVLEKRPKGSNKWSKCPGHIDPDETEATAKNLDEGQEYDFRVVAVNKEGESEPLVTTAPIKAKYPFGALFFVSAISLSISRPCNGWRKVK